MSNHTRIAIKVDVDTQVGTREGVPRLREIFEARGIRASFFLSLGPDNSGRAIWRAFTRPGFMAKQLRTRAPSAYGLKTMLYGTLLPAPIIGRGLEKLGRSLTDAGHEVGLHAWDHVLWHDRLWKMQPAEVVAEVGRGLGAFTKLLGSRPDGFAAPAWRINAPAAAVLQDAGLTYMSTTRGISPYWPEIEGRLFHLLEIPTTLPTADEILGRQGVTPNNLDSFFLSLLGQPGLHVLTIHAEMEGKALAPVFARLLDRALDQGSNFFRLNDLAHEYLAHSEAIPTGQVIRKLIPGRPGEVSFQLPIEKTPGPYRSI